MQITLCLISHISVNKGARGIIILLNVRIDVSIDANQKLPTSGLSCKDATHIIIKVYNEFTYYKTFILLIIWVNTIQLAN